MHSLAGDISSGLEGVGGDALAVTTVVTLVHLTVVADVLRQTATLSRPVGTLQTGASVEAVALAAACSHTHTRQYCTGTSNRIPMTSLLFCTRNSPFKLDKPSQVEDLS